MTRNSFPLNRILSPVYAAAVLIALFAAAAMPVRPVYAASTINVNTTVDENGGGTNCSLREALTTANTNSNFGGCTNATGGPFTINVPAGTYSLTAGELQVGTTSGANITISGAGAASTIIRQSAAVCTAGTARVFDLDPSVVGNVAVTISGVTISNGAAQAFGGGAILGGGTGDTLNLSNSVISNNCTAGFFSAAGISWSPAGNLTITNTTFSNNLSGQGAGAILYTTGTGSTLTISNSTFSGNTAAATGGAGGALLLGGNGGSPTFNINGSAFTNNQATNASGIGGAIYIGGGTLNLGGTVVNTFAGNTAGISTSGGLGVRGGTANAANNWWSCNGGPGVGAGCDRADNSGGTLTFTPWVVLTNTASPNTILVNQSTTLTADFLHNSAAGALSLSQVAPLLGRSVSWGSAVKGSLSSAQTTIQSNGTATATFTASAAGAGSASATVDNGAATAGITINKAGTTTTLNSDTPDPSVTGQSVTVTYSVTSDTGSTPTAPSGNVTVSDGTNSCTGTLAAGTCTLTFTSAGSKSLTATYAGDANFNTSSSSPAVAHTVNKADTTTTITSDAPDPSLSNQSVTVNYTVAANSPGSGTPTGNVTVSDGVNSCTGTVAAGSCSVTLTSVGARTLTAAYAGDSNFNGSTSAGEPHTVNPADTTPPDTSITAQPANPTNSTSASFSFTGTDNSGGSGVASFECQLDGSGFSACTSPQSYSGLAEGSHTFQVRAIDGATNADPTPASYTWVIDTTAPAVAINQASGQADPTSSSPIHFTAVFTEPVTGLASSDVSLGGTAGATTAVVTEIAPNDGTTYDVVVSGMSMDGSVTASIPANGASDTAGNGNTASTSTDNTVGFVLSVPDLTVSKSHSGDFHQGQTGAQYTITVSNTGTGPTSGTVTVVDTLPAGLTGTAMSGTGWSCSLATLTCTRSDVLATGSSYPNITLTLDVAVNAPASLTNSVTVSGGGETNTSNDTATDPTTVIQDNTPPDTTIDSSPSDPSYSTAASFTFSGTDNQTPSGSLTFECELDGGAFGACTSPKSYSGLSLGSHTFQVRAIDLVGNVDLTPASFTWQIMAHTSLLYNGAQIVNIGNSFKPAALLSSPAAACASGKTISFSLDRNPTTGAAGSYSLGTAVTNSSGQATMSAVGTTGWQEGIYDITASFAGTANCDPSSYTATFTAAAPGTSANGGGWYTLSGSGRVNFGFTVRKVDSKCTSNCAYKGQLLLINNGKWRLKGTLDTYSKTSTGNGASSGTGDLYWWDSTLNGGLGDWALAQSGVSFTINFYDSGKTGKSSTDAFGINIQYLPVPPQPANLPNSKPIVLKGGNITVK